MKIILVMHGMMFIPSIYCSVQPNDSTAHAYNPDWAMRIEERVVLLEALVDKLQQENAALIKQLPVQSTIQNYGTGDVTVNHDDEQYNKIKKVKSYCLRLASNSTIINNSTFKGVSFCSNMNWGNIIIGNSYTSDFNMIGISFLAIICGALCAWKYC